MKNILIICLFFSLFSCEKEKKKETIIKQNKNTSSEVLISETKVIIDTSYSDTNSIKDYCIALEYLKNEYTEKIKENSSIENNNELYEKYKLLRNAYIKNLNISSASILDRYLDYYNEDKEEYVLPNDVKKIQEKLKMVDVEFLYIGEGYTELRNKPQHFWNIFKAKVTPDYEDYIKQIANQNKELYSVDAGLIVPFKEVGDRVIFWENFITKYPKSKLLPKSRMHYNNYLHDFIFGLDNTPSFEDGKIDPVFNEVYVDFIKKYPNSLSTNKIKDLPNLVGKSMSYEEIEKKLKLEDRIWEDE